MGKLTLGAKFTAAHWHPSHYPLGGRVTYTYTESRGTRIDDLPVVLGKVATGRSSNLTTVMP